MERLSLERLSEQRLGFQGMAATAAERLPTRSGAAARRHGWRLVPFMAARREEGREEVGEADRWYFCGGGCVEARAARAESLGFLQVPTVSEVSASWWPDIKQIGSNHQVNLNWYLPNHCWKTIVFPKYVFVVRLGPTSTPPAPNQPRPYEIACGWVGRLAGGGGGGWMTTVGRRCNLGCWGRASNRCEQSMGKLGAVFGAWWVGVWMSGGRERRGHGWVAGFLD